MTEAIILVYGEENYFFFIWKGGLTLELFDIFG
jgi:hypothetical protein